MGLSQPRVVLATCLWPDSLSLFLCDPGRWLCKLITQEEALCLLEGIS